MRLIFDAIIVFTLLFSGYWFFLILRSFFVFKKRIKTKLVRVSLLCALGLIFLTVLYGSFILPQRLILKKVNIDIGKTAEHEKIKIAFISDLHVGQYKQDDFVKKVVAATQCANPDIIILGGDFLLGDEKYSKYLYPLAELSAEYPTYAVMGNHEYNQNENRSKLLIDKTATIRKMFAEYNIAILDNENRVISVQGKKFNLAGIMDLWTDRADLNKAQEKRLEGVPSILISHNPDVTLEPDVQNFDLILSGHTHGGQIRLPWIGSVPEIPDKLGRAFDQGLFKIKNGQLFISAGAGETGPRARLFSKPEVDLIVLDL